MPFWGYFMFAEKNIFNSSTGPGTLLWGPVSPSTLQMYNDMR